MTRVKGAPDMNSYEYELMTKSWHGPEGAAMNQTFEFCVEFGWMDHMGIVTQRGQKAIKEYEEFYKPSYSQGAVPRLPG